MQVDAAARVSIGYGVFTVVFISSVGVVAEGFERADDFRLVARSNDSRSDFSSSVFTVRISSIVHSAASAHAARMSFGMLLLLS